MIKKTSRITILASLLVATMVNAQEFYTCVPKRDWWVGIVRDGSLKGIWKKIIHLTPASPGKDFQQTLYIGKYRVTAAAAGGREEVRYFNLDKETEFRACVGKSGTSGQQCSINDYKGCYGGWGGSIIGYKGLIFGGKGGLSTSLFSSPTSGDDGKGYGEGFSGRGGYVPYTKAFRVKGEGGKGGYGCYSGGGGSGGKRAGGGGGGGGGSYFEISYVKLILNGADGKSPNGNKAGDGAIPDGYVIVEKME